MPYLIINKLYYYETNYSILTLMIATSSVSLGQNVEEMLMQIEQELTNAFLKNDASVIEKYFADTYTFTDPGGGIHSKKEAIDDMRNGLFKFDSLQNDSMKVQVYGNAAVVTFLSNEKGHVGDMDVSGEYRWTNMFVLMNNRWQVVAGQGTRIRR
jgi:Domain of unknown function (DUF4440)